MTGCGLGSATACRDGRSDEAGKGVRRHSADGTVSRGSRKWRAEGGGRTLGVELCSACCSCGKVERERGRKEKGEKREKEKGGERKGKERRRWWDSQRRTRNEEEQRDGMVIGTGVGTADRRKMISGDWSRIEKIFKRFELNDEKDLETNL